MNEKQLAALLQRVRDKEQSIDNAVKELRDFPMVELEEASLDTHRHLRRGFPEVVLAEGKTTEQVVTIVGRLLDGAHNVLATRVAPDVADELLAAYPGRGGAYEASAKVVVFQPQPVEQSGRGSIMVVTAGTADIGVAEEARLTAELMGNTVERIFDVGVAGIHRLLRHRDRLLSAEVIIVVAGMEGALPSVISGLVDRPVIAVPTSTGYGAAFDGLTAMLSMLTACAAGITVVNIDNGFGAGYAAALMNRRRKDTQ